MKKIMPVLAMPLLAALLAASAAEAKGPQPVRFSGCVRPGVVHGCLMVQSGAVLYNISPALPRPAPGRWIAGDGIQMGGITNCQQGIVLRRIHWQYVRRICPLPMPLPRRH